MNTNWNSYKIFYYVASTGTTTGASRCLHIAQPAVSHGIRQLEETFGCSLFKRSSKGMELTEAGQLLFDNIKDAVIQIEQAEERMVIEQKAATTDINIASIDVTMQHFLIPYLDEYEEHNPTVRINTHSCRTAADTKQKLDSGEADFAVHYVPFESDDYESIPIKEVRDIVVYSPKFKDLLKQDKVMLKELLNYPLVLHEKGCATREYLDRLFARYGLTLEDTYSYSLNSSIIYQIRRKFALGILLEDVVRDEIEAGMLAKLEVEPPLPPRYFYLIKPKTVQSRAARKLIEYILDSKQSKFH